MKRKIKVRETEHAPDGKKDGVHVALLKHHRKSDDPRELRRKRHGVELQRSKNELHEGARRNGTRGGREEEGLQKLLGFPAPARASLGQDVGFVVVHDRGSGKTAGARVASVAERPASGKGQGTGIAPERQRPGRSHDHPKPGWYRDRPGKRRPTPRRPVKFVREPPGPATAPDVRPLPALRFFLRPQAPTARDTPRGARVCRSRVPSENPSARAASSDPT